MFVPLSLISHTQSITTGGEAPNLALLLHTSLPIKISQFISFFPQASLYSLSPQCLNVLLGQPNILDQEHCKAS